MLIRLLKDLFLARTISHKIAVTSQVWFIFDEVSQHLAKGFIDKRTKSSRPDVFNSEVILSVDI